MWLFIAFLVVPLIEIGLFIQVGGWIGLWPTLAIVVVTAAVGTLLVRAQGRLAIGRLRSSFERLEDPSEPLAHGAMILVSGALLLTPGFFTDAVGFALLAPPVRHAVFVWISRRVVTQRFEMGGERPGPQGPRARDTVIDGDYRDLGDADAGADPDPADPDPPRDGRGSGWTRP